MKLNIYPYIFSCLLALLLASTSSGQVKVTSSDSLSCTVHCTTLTAHVTGDTPTNAGVTEDDVYSPAISIGFPFTFYGTTYSQVLLGANGDLSFNTALAGGFDDWSISAPLLGNSEKFNSICCPWCDIDIFYTGVAVGTETYSTDGVAPFRKFVVTWCACSMFSCGTQLTTTQCIIYETTNVIEVHIAQKPICSTWNGGYAIVGVQNAAGTSAVTAPGRDYPSTWSIPPTEAWRFTPTDAMDTAYTVAAIPFAPVPYANSTIYWYNANTDAFIDTGTNITVCPTTATTYKAGALGCGADTSWGYYTVSPASLLVISETSTNPSECGACDGTITISGLVPFLSTTINYDLAGVAQTPFTALASASGTITLTGLCAGTYTNFAASQLGGCASIPAGSVTLTNPPISISSVDTTNPTHCGFCDGTITLNGLFPLHPYVINYQDNGYSHSPVSVTTNSLGSVTLSGLCAGVYSNIIASFGSCVTPAVGPYTLVSPAPPPLVIVSSSSPTQCGYCDGDIIISAVPPYLADTIFYTKGSTPEPGVIAVASADSTLHFVGLCAGDYSRIEVAIGPCLAPVIGAAHLQDPAIHANFRQSEHFGCHGDTVFYTNLSSSTGPLYYTWNFGDGTSSIAANPYHIFSQGVYTVTLTATDHFCSVDTTTKDSLVHPLFVSVNATPDLICQNNGTVAFTDSVVGTQLSYKWIFADGGTSIAEDTSHTYTRSGTYTVQHIITDFVPCSDTATTVVQVDSLQPLDITQSDSVQCNGTSVTLFGSYTEIGNTGITWNFGDGDSLQNRNPVHYSFPSVGVYTVTATAYYRACPTESNSKVLHLYGAPSLSVAGDTAICPGGNSISLGSDVETVPGETWLWSTGETTPAIIITSPGAYWVKASLNGCSTTDSINVANNCYIDMPNVFTPNGDGVNDYFFPRQMLTKGLKTFSMQIYNRWGQELFNTSSTSGEGWDGKYNGVDQPTGVYVYVIDATFIDGQKQHRQGNITLLR